MTTSTANKTYAYVFIQGEEMPLQFDLISGIKSKEWIEILIKQGGIWQTDELGVEIFRPYHTIELITFDPVP